jgi:hypothetical protein
LFSATLVSAQDKKKPKPQIVEASCGQCQFGMEGHGCELAVRIDGKSILLTEVPSPMVMRMPVMVLLCHKKRKWLVKWLTINSKSPHSNYCQKK